MGYVDTLTFQPFKGYRFNWPYLVFAGFGGSIWILNAYDMTFITRLAAPQEGTAKAKV